MGELDMKSKLLAHVASFLCQVFHGTEFPLLEDNKEKKRKKLSWFPQYVISLILLPGKFLQKTLLSGSKNQSRSL